MEANCNYSNDIKDQFGIHSNYMTKLYGLEDEVDLLYQKAHKTSDQPAKGWFGRVYDTIDKIRVSRISNSIENFVKELHSGGPKNLTFQQNLIIYKEALRVQDKVKCLAKILLPNSSNDVESETQSAKGKILEKLPRSLITTFKYHTKYNEFLDSAYSDFLVQSMPKTAGVMAIVGSAIDNSDNLTQEQKELLHKEMKYKPSYELNNGVHGEHKPWSEVTQDDIDELNKSLIAFRDMFKDTHPIIHDEFMPERTLLVTELSKQIIRIQKALGEKLSVTNADHEIDEMFSDNKNERH